MGRHVKAEECWTDGRGGFRVFLDGVEMDLATEAHEGPDGFVVLDGGETRRGDVRLEAIDTPPPIYIAPEDVAGIAQLIRMLRAGTL